MPKNACFDELSASRLIFTYFPNVLDGILRKKPTGGMTYPADRLFAELHCKHAGNRYGEG